MEQNVQRIGSGKVRDIYDVGNNQLVIATTDRISAFDVVLPNIIYMKGSVLNRMSAFWMDFLWRRQRILHHMITIDNEKMPKFFQQGAFLGRCMLVKKLKMFPIECVVRGYITGSGWSSYQKTGSVCGINLPAGLKESEKLPEPIYTPTTKAAIGHDEPISYEQTIELVGEKFAQQLKELSLEIYSVCAEYALERGIIIADTKFEFGVSEDGEVTLADEVLTPDSSRFWPVDGYEAGKSQPSFDKQGLRIWLKTSGWNQKLPAPEIPSIVVENTVHRYIEAYERITGEHF